MAEASVLAGKSGIYEIVNTINGKKYIGSTKSFHHRWKIHKLHLNRGTHHSPHLQYSWKKHGAEAFDFRVRLFCDEAELLILEQEALDAERPAFNVLPSAGSSRGHKASAETRAKLSASKMGNTATLGHKHTPETIEKMRQSKLGRPSPTKGMRRDPAAIAATAAANRGQKRSAETRAKIGAKAKGREWTEEAKAKLSATTSGRTLSESHRQKLVGNKHALGSKHTEEWKASNSARNRGVKRPKDEAWRAKIADSLRGRKLSEERVKLMSEASKLMWSDPVKRAHILAAKALAAARKKQADR